ncbi:BspA family leucine-rich repeat surface protein [Lactobacillus rodentium]|uniref:Gram-positive cocci surface proteins LPxTG domain-containing protein n=1 Tax=Lactobacillus rodentium TaxID=947835 RepID=A0A2Z6T821_9LACO|nr:BspA family leucine-rich repeat surface protein [Lactobacillus rodentium]MCR1894141.1 BspA family leucine-rich repeat surface protein [Lactobacillus rodentium]GBG04438.1 hypothetical protein LrDSM24759_03520 [Lactobacillus rodentium]
MQKNYEDTKHHFSIRKLTIGAASVLIGTTFYLTSGNIVHADTFTPASDQQETAALNNNQDDSSKVQANLDNQTDDTNRSRSETGAISQLSKKSASAMKNTDSQSANTKIDNTKVADNNIQKTEKLSANAVSSSIQNDVKQIKLVKTEQVANDTQDIKSTPTFVPVNANDWNTQIDGDEFLITGYKGSDTTSNLTIPNSADFEEAGFNTNGLQTFANIETVKNLIRNGVAPKLSDTDGQKVALLRRNSNDIDTFTNSNLTDISGLANADTSHITDMYSMFDHNKISDLSPLSNWDTTNVTDMSSMFDHNEISDLSPLSKWNVANVTDMDRMFWNNKINDLNSLIKWNVANVTNMSYMFYNNQISDLIPLSKWNVTNVTNMSYMFYNNQISDLVPLSKWNVTNVTNMSLMFEYNQISDLSPLFNWDTTNVTDMSSMFDHNKISNLTPLSNWNVSHVTNMYVMFGNNQIDDLTPLSNWDVSNVTDMKNIFLNNQIDDLTPLSNWDVSNVTDMRGMFYMNPIKTGDLSKWNMLNVVDTDLMIDENSAAVIYLGNNTNLPTNFIDPKNENIFTTSKGGHLIVTSNHDLLANPNKAFNKITFSNGTTMDTPVFINAENNDESILNAVKQAVDNAIETKKTELEKANPNKIVTLSLASNTTDPIKLANSNVNISMTDKYRDVTKDHENDSNVDTATKWTVNETINVTDPSGNKTVPVNKFVTFTRTATKDKLTGDVTYGTWNKQSDTFEAYTAPTYAGYTPSQSSISAQTVKPGDKDLTFNITYTANTQTGEIVYVDQDGNRVGTTPITGKTDETINITPEVPDGYVLDGDKDVPTTITVPADGIPNITVSVIKKVTSNGDVAETDKLPIKNIIVYKDDNGDVVGTEEITGESNDKVKPNIPEGYFNGDVTDITIPESGVVTITVVKKETSNGDVAETDKLPTKNVIIYKDNNGNVVGNEEVEGKPGAKVKPNIPEGYYSGDTTEVTIPESGIVEVTVTKKETSTGDVANTDALPAKNIIIYKDDNGDVVDTQEITGKPGDKAKPNIPEGYWNGDITDITIPESGVVPVTVVKKETSTGDVEETDILPTKNVIIYKDKNGDVAGVQEITGKPNDKITPKIPEGYWTGDVTDITIPESGIAIVNVVKKETSNGDVANPDALPTKNVIIYKNGNGDVVGTQEITGKPNDKVTLNIPEGYWNGDIDEVTIPESGIVEVTVIKKKTSNGDVTAIDALPTKNVIIYKDGNGDVVGTEEVTGKPNDKVTPNIPDGYYTGDITEVTIPEGGIATVNVVKKKTSNGDVANTDVLPIKTVVMYKDGNGDVVGTQDITGKPGEKVTPKIPDGYYTGDTTEVTIPEDGAPITVNVVKKETSNGDAANPEALPTKNVIIYKDGNGDVVGTEEVDGKPGDKIKPHIPDGYYTGDTTEVTIPENGIVTVKVVKKETSNGDSLIQPSLPAYTEPSDNNNDSDVTLDVPNVPNSGNNKSQQDNSNTQIIERVANNSSDAHMDEATNASSGNKQNTLPQTGENDANMVAVGALFVSLGALMSGLYSRLRKRN